ncbi:XrtN system VIT domain-containing protein [Chryseolinea sp. H1M3-3]|uniref:XrtN system VIT domain-containing protein n=1 Tax=Chryseolinea sp. H1M3-3 TaxID=3034144 RepID=UPI0023EC75A4|nr:XrtN system VIT domain-containing protein [Chryseolinea sp. H1M3-3]
MNTITEPLPSINPGVANTEHERTSQNIRLGYVLLTVSFFLFVLFEHLDLNRRDDSLTVFVLHYVVAVVYAIVLARNDAYGIRKSWRKENINRTVILLSLFLISAFALNRSLPVFAESTTWLSAYLIITSLFLLSFQYFDRLNVWINRLQLLVAGSAVVLHFYLAAYVANIYGIGIIGILFFGIGTHIFVPLTMAAVCAFLIRYATDQQRTSIYWASAGAMLTLAFVLVFMGEWNSRISKIEAMNNQSVLRQNYGLPTWVAVTQHLEKDWISEKILKSDLVYTTHNKDFQWDFFPANRFWGEPRKHDPLVFISSLISRCPISYDDRVKILQSIFADRHQSNERLWSGDNLTTSYIVSDVDIYPALRLAYVEKYLSVRNNISDNSWREQTQEAIYTFQLPEGSVVTALSLWINGKEEKGILTSKQKATTAYKTIVGVEQRDPSVIHWQEGNTVTVRVFPCTPEEERKFKIGITCPLVDDGDDIIFKNITFRGPFAHHANETVRIRLIGESQDVVLPHYFKKDAKGDYITEQRYNPDFQFAFKKVPLPSNQFTFDGYTYALRPHRPSLQPANISQIFLDINNSWTRKEVKAAESLLDTHKIYATVDDGFVQLTDENWDDLTGVMRQYNFSIFPFHRIHNLENSLIVTKGKGLSPHLSDFKDSQFAEDVGRYFESGKQVKVYNLEGGTSTYVSSLRELRGLQYAQGKFDQLNDWLIQKKYPRPEESDGNIILHDSKLEITKNKINRESKIKNNAPDHLARLFAYNNIMRKVGAHYFNDDFISQELVDEAASAYVVSPVSSLIVLETQKDYDRFGIEESVNSLHNATKESTGAVPEPHEWALIILFLGFICYLKVRRYKLCTAL